MKSKIIRIAGVALIFLGLVALVNWQRNQIKSLKSRTANLVKVAERDSLSAEFYKNEYGREVARNEVINLTHADALKLLDTRHLNYLKEIEGLKRNLRNLEAAVQVKTELKFDTKLPLLDSLVTLTNGLISDMPNTTILKTWEYSDKYNHFSGIIFPDSISLKGKADIELFGAVHWQRKKVIGLRIGKKQYFNDFYTPNELAEIKGTEFIKVVKKK